jgi:hypothetical protein
MEIRYALKRVAMLAIENDVLRVLDLITITWKNDSYLLNRGIRGIVVPSVTILIKVEREYSLLVWRQMGSQLSSLLVELNSWVTVI